jgi:hypothetical protein
MCARYISANNQVHELEEDSSGCIDIGEVRSSMGLHSDRALVLQRRNGSNEALASAGRFPVRPDDILTDIPIGVRGK